MQYQGTVHNLLNVSSSDLSNCLQAPELYVVDGVVRLVFVVQFEHEADLHLCFVGTKTHVATFDSPAGTLYGIISYLLSAEAFSCSDAVPFRQVSSACD